VGRFTEPARIGPQRRPGVLTVTAPLPDGEKSIADPVVPFHPQVSVSLPGREAEVDEEIADLIIAMNAAGIDTILSCQDNNAGRGTARRVWVYIFAGQLLRFLEILNRPGELEDWESLSCRSAPEFEPRDWQEYRDNRCWHYAMQVERVDGELCYPTVSIRFPYADLGEVVARLLAGL
jgi:hypothetical protein